MTVNIPSYIFGQKRTIVWTSNRIIIMSLKVRTKWKLTVSKFKNIILTTFDFLLFKMFFAHINVSSFDYFAKIRIDNTISRNYFNPLVAGLFRFLVFSRRKAKNSYASITSTYSATENLTTSSWHVGVTFEILHFFRASSSKCHAETLHEKTGRAL